MGKLLVTIFLTISNYPSPINYAPSLALQYEIALGKLYQLWQDLVSVVWRGLEQLMTIFTVYL